MGSRKRAVGDQARLHTSSLRADRGCSGSPGCPPPWSVGCNATGRMCRRRTSRTGTRSPRAVRWDRQCQGSRTRHFLREGGHWPAGSCSRALCSPECSQRCDGRFHRVISQVSSPPRSLGRTGRARKPPAPPPASFRSCARLRVSSHRCESQERSAGQLPAEPGCCQRLAPGATSFTRESEGLQTSRM